MFTNPQFRLATRRTLKTPPYCQCSSHFLSCRSVGEDGLRIFVTPFFLSVASAPLWQKPFPPQIKNYQTNPFPKNQNTCKQRVSSPCIAKHTKKRTHPCRAEA